MTMPSMAGPTPQTVLQAASQVEPQATVGMASASIQVSGEQETDLVDKLTAAIDYHQQTFQPYLDKSEEWQKMFMEKIFHSSTVLPQKKIEQISKNC